MSDGTEFLSDGGKTDHPLTPTSNLLEHEVLALFHAWLIERGRSVEGLLLLGRVHRLLRRIAAGGLPTERHQREVKNLIRAIDEFTRHNESNLI